jgi:hypothetical protein
MRELKIHKDNVESRLELARELNFGEAEAIAEIRAEIVELKKLIEAHAQPSAFEPLIKEVEKTAQALVTANTTTNHVLTAIKPAIGD